MFCKICDENIGQMIKASASAGLHSLPSPSSSIYCAFCYGLLIDEHFMDAIAEECSHVFTKEQYDGSSFLLALNMPITQMLREFIVEKIVDKWAPASMSTKELFSRCLMAKIAKVMMPG
jgi:hypothetical protein